MAASSLASGCVGLLDDPQVEVHPAPFVLEDPRPQAHALPCFEASHELVYQVVELVQRPEHRVTRALLGGPGRMRWDDALDHPVLRRLRGEV